MKEEIVYLPAAELKPYKNNPRDNAGAVNAVAESIRKFGFRSPIVIDENNTVINGHTRLKAAKKLGIQYVPCVRVTDLTEEQKKEYRLIDNKTSEYAKWDQDLLAVELKECNFEGIDFDFHFEDDLRKIHSWRHTEKLCSLEYKPRMRKAGQTHYHSIFKTGKEGKPLEEIKTAEFVEIFAQDAAATLDAILLGPNLSKSAWCAVTAPSRRSEREGKIHFATEVCRSMAGIIGIPFREGTIKSYNFRRMDPDFRLEKRPQEQNVILYDDIITTGYTINAVRELLISDGYTVLPLISIDNH